MSVIQAVLRSGVGALCVMLGIAQAAAAAANVDTARVPEEDLGSIKVFRDIPYRDGDSEAWRLDLAMPAERTAEPRPALVIVHGGGWLRAHAGEYHVDPDRIGAYGHSAGAHLAMMLAMVPKSAGLEGDGGWEEHSSIVNAVASGSPPTELGRDVPMAQREWWPIGYISAGHPPMLLIQGSEDRTVRAELTDDFVEEMNAEGADIQYPEGPV